MQKPIDLIVEDFRMGLSDFINSNQQLPLSMVVIIVNEMANSVNNQYSQYKARLQEDYKQALIKEQEQEQEQQKKQEKTE